MQWRSLLRPSWLALTAVVVCFAVVAFTLLAPWQFRRAAERAERNAAIESSFSTPPRPLRDVLAAQAAPTAATEWQRVQLTGRYLPDAELVVRLRTVLGEPAYEVVIPLRLVDGSTMLVNRGYVRPVEGVRIPEYPPVPGGEVTVTGRLRAEEPDPHDGEVVQQDGHRQVYAVSTRTVSAVTGVPLEPGHVQLVEGAPGVLSELPLPQLNPGPSYAYALQWIAFGTMAPLGLAYFAWREATQRRRENSVDVDADDPHDPPLAALADRYGR
ncbi:MAG: SURF1 family protein [Actinomycetota bacterium]|nr:SURF1 family protein [Actinomycetota bacterium]